MKGRWHLRWEMRESRLVQEFMREGELARLQADLLKVLRSRFGEGPASDLAANIKALNDLELLERLFDQALAGVSLEDFRSALPAAEAPRRDNPRGSGRRDHR
jgi:hypothetical protein